ncbi:TRAP transporter substrate-binding protein DctP [Martelella soudanensis]|uniref:TRAP transporter substrate-binding protein DctP n=1 Tax=Martelella sp. NC18 TaxID=2740297 RepID=UPI0015DEC475|nr:TRAP transporter substrate-binding protein DctP [Martelella sp. NC18]
MKNFGLAAATVGVIAGIATPVLADEIKVAHITPEASAISQADLAFANELAEKSQGEHKFTFFWSGSLGAGNEIIPLIKGGAIRAGVTAPAYYPSDMPLSGVTNTVPALFPDAGVAMDVSTELRENAAVVAEFERNGVFPIIVQALPTAHLQCRDKVETLEDLKGKKVRSYGSFLPVMFESIGMVPVNMGLNEIYEGIERGVIDCTSFGYDLSKSYNIHEVAPFYSDIALGHSLDRSFTQAGTITRMEVGRILSRRWLMKWPPSTLN